MPSHLQRSPPIINKQQNQKTPCDSIGIKIHLKTITSYKYCYILVLKLETSF